MERSKFAMRGMKNNNNNWRYCGAPFWGRPVCFTGRLGNAAIIICSGIGSGVCAATIVSCQLSLSIYQR